MYSAELLEQKSLKELKAIAVELGIVPSGDRRLKQVWILAIDLAAKTSPGVRVYSFPKSKKHAEARNVLAYLRYDKNEIDAIEYERICSIRHSTHKTYAEMEKLGYRWETGCPGSWERVANRVREPIEVQATEPIEVQATEPIEVQHQEPIELAAKTFPGVEVDCVREPIQPAVENSLAVTFSSRFLALYVAPQSENISYKPDAGGQLSLFDFEVESIDEPPDPDDFDSIDAFYEEMARWDAEHPEPTFVNDEPLEVLLTSTASMCQWAFCPEEWYWPPSSDEPPTAGVGARLPKPKPPYFPPTFIVEDVKRCPCGAMPAACCDGTTATHIYPDRIVFTPCYKQLDGVLVCGRSPPGGDAVQ